MNTMRFIRKACIFAAAFVPLAATANDALALQIGSARVTEAGIACRSNPVANVGASWSSLGNWSGTTQTFWCPLTNFNGSRVNLYVDVTPGWATTSSCYVSFMNNATNGYWYNPNNIISQQSAGYDSVHFDLSPDTTTLSGAVQCNVLNNQLLIDYNSETHFDFDSTTW